MRGRKKKGSKKGRMGLKKGQRAKVLLCDTRERKVEVSKGNIDRVGQCHSSDIAH